MKNNTFVMAEEPKQMYMFWGMLCIALSVMLSASLLGYLWFNQSQYGQDMALPYDLLLSQQTAMEAGPATKADKPTEEKATVSDSNVIVRKTQATEASENAITAMNSGNVEKAKESLPFSNEQVKDMVNLRVMLKEQPHQLLSYIQKHYEYENSPELIALGAQGQQRSGRHKSAVVLYRKLIRMQPNEAKWRAGIAISYEILGMGQKAKSSYLLALNMPGLPSELRTFSENRLAYLK